jgi:ribosomal protein S18 acetylase RimI-like enzyme
VVADLDGTVAGFAHTVFNADPTWGALLDNLHVRHDVKRQGVGGRLLAEAARAVAHRTPPTGLYLWVLAQNMAAQAFYRTHGGVRVERQLAGPFPGGGRAFAFRYAWQDLSSLTG